MAGLRQLVDEFFDRMGSDERFATIYALHPDDKEGSRDKLARFLCGWLGGPKLYNEKYGAIAIPRAHAHLAITTLERDQWLTCMTETVEEQPFAPDFKKYLMEQLFVPAEDNPVSDAIGRFYDGFAETLDTDLTLEEILPFYVSGMPYYQRLYASALSRSIRGAVTLGGQSSTSCRRWQALLPGLDRTLVAAQRLNSVSGASVA